ncbi:MAG TPA: diacylglycerol kinase family protein [Nocardioidaceae bacterium]|nr:diacylglycerol kinase family protein [Nocardioidaceae bacterium]
MSTNASTRARLMIWATLCLAVLVTLSLMVSLHWQPLQDLDDAVGRGPQGVTLRNPLLFDLLYLIQFAFNTLPLLIYTLLVAIALVTRGHRRAAYWTVAVMVGASLTNRLLKWLFQRDRPLWEDPLQTLNSFSFPSGHAAGIASAMGVATVLTLMLVRRRGLRSWLVTLWVLVALTVGADRVFLGVHNISDVVAGYAVGLLWVLVGLVLYHPAPRTKLMQALASPLPSTKHLAVVLNPVKVENVVAFKSLVAQMAEESGWIEPVWHETLVEDTGKSMAEAAAVGGADLVLVCGGDGTVRTVCAELAGTGIPVGIVPAGTGNLLARNLGIPLFLQTAIDVALNGQDRAIDLVAVSGDGIDPDEHFMVMGGMGFDAAIMEGANEQIKARVGWLAYVLSALRNLMFPAVRLEISMDDGPFTKHRVRTVVVGNVGYLQAGIPLLPDAAIDDGVLDVVLVSPRRFLSWVPLAVRVLSKNKRTDAALDRMTGRKVSIKAAHETPRQLDGDSIGAGKELHAECVHGRLLVRVPR